MSDQSPLCRTCAGQRWISTEARDIGFDRPAASFGAILAADRAALEAPRIGCPTCKAAPWPWDRERLAADAVRIAQAYRVAA